MKINVHGVIVPNDDGMIYDFFDIENTSPAKVEAALDKANGEDVDVDLNSGGGDVFSGSEIYNALRSYGGKVRIHVSGLAASAASVIMCAAESDAAPTAQIMVHNVSTTARGNYHDMEKTADILKTANKAIAAAYVDKTGMSEEEALKMMDKETWLTAKQAVEIGLVDRIAESKQTSERTDMAADIGGLLPRSVIDRYKAEFNALRKKFEED